VNVLALTDAMLPTLQRVAGADKVQFVPKVTGSEDFSYSQQRVPGLFFFVGATWLEIDPAKAPANHSPRFHVDERALPLGVRSLAHLVGDFLAGR
jgi:metal-dependent amidase/aminoacylase/carboxypeptidase family protein